MSSNPYASPASGIASTARPREIRLYTPQHVAGATFLGGPLAGFLLMATNYRRMGHSDAAIGSVLVGLLATAVLAMIGILMPGLPSGTGTLICIASIFLMSTLAKNMQGEDVEAHVQRGGKTASVWIALGIGLLVLAAEFVVLCGIALLVL